MEWWQAIILGLVEGITEYLPVSSTGHLIIASSLLGLDEGPNKEAIDAFTIAVQGGAILAVLGLYWPRFVRMLRGLLGRDPAGARLVLNLALAFFPAAVLGLLLNEAIEAHLFRPGPVIAALALGGVFMMLVDAWRGGRLSMRPPAWTHKEIDQLRPHEALLIGLLQCVAMWPGTSRSMMTISGGMLVGLRPAAAAEFSFLLGAPTLGAACLYTLYKDLSRDGGGDGMFGTLGIGPVLLGFAVATVSAAVAVRWLVGFLNRHGLTPFGWYRILLAVVLLGLISGGLVGGGAFEQAADAPGPAVEPIQEPAPGASVPETRP